MAYLRKVKGGWRAEVVRAGVRKSKTLPTKVEATNWAAQEEAAILSSERGQFPRRTLSEALTEYVDKVSSKKRGFRFEMLRAEAFKGDFKELAGKVLSEITTPDMAKWRDARLEKVSAGSVQREINFLRNVFTVARNEWKWCGESPFKGLRMPGDNPPRTKRMGWRLVRRLCRWLGYRTGHAPKSKQQEVAYALLVALRTGMRAGEVLQLSDETVNMVTRVARVAHKTQHLTGRPREIPLSKQAIRVMTPLSGRGDYFRLSSASLDALFRKARDAMLLGDVHFHDSRAEALTLLARKVDVMTLARISGHKDLRLLLAVYYRESAEDIAKRL